MPSPHVAEDHQTENANALVRSHAAKLIKDDEAVNGLLNEAYELIDQPSNIERLEREIKKLAKPNAINHIVDKIMELRAN